MTKRRLPVVARLILRALVPLRVEVGQAARALLRRPAYSMLAVATLAIGIGANAAVFTMANWLLFRPIAGVDAPDRLVTIRFGSTEGFLFPLSEPDRADIETTIPSFAAVAGYQTIALHVAASPDAQARRLDAQVVSGNYFDVLGPAVVSAGRTFAANERTDAGAALVALISHRMWQQDFGLAPTAIGSPMLINGQRFTVIGIAEPGFHGTERSGNADLWVPVAAHSVVMPNYPATALTSRRTTIFVGLIARLRDAATAQSASSDLEVLRTRLLAAEPSNRRLQMSRYLVDEGLTARAWERDRLSRVFAMLLATVGLLLMLTCANVSNLMLARATARRAELATRQALGASRARIAVQWLLESLLLSSAGCALALAGAAWTASVMRGVIILPGIPELGDVSLDARVFLFAVGLSTVTAAVAAVLPAMTADRQDLLTALKTSSRTLVPGRRRVRQALMVAQVALSLALLVGAFLLARSMHERRSIDPGFDLARVLTFTIEPGLQGLNGERKGAFYTALTARLRELPAVSSASLAWIRPYAMILDDADVRTGDAPDGAAVNAERNWVGSGYFATMGIGLIDGREFTGSELHRSENVPPHTVILNEPLARRLEEVGGRQKSKIAGSEVRHDETASNDRPPCHDPGRPTTFHSSATSRFTRRCAAGRENGHRNHPGKGDRSGDRAAGAPGHRDADDGRQDRAALRRTVAGVYR